MAVMWTTGPGDVHEPYCDQVNTPCYVYEGSSITISIYKPSAQVTFSPDTASLPSAGATATFSVMISPSTFEGHPMNFAIKRWLFTPEGGAQATICPGVFGGLPTSPCQFVPTMSGTIQVDVVAQGDSIRMTGRVKVPCVTNPPDTLVNNVPAFQQLLRDAMAGSRPDSTPSLRFERGGQVRCNYGVCSFELNAIDPTDTPCRSVQGPDVANGVVIQIHTHPFTPGSATDTVPTNPVLCPHVAPLAPNQVYTLKPGPSAVDFAVIANNSLLNNRAISAYIVDKDWIYFVPGPPPGALNVGSTASQVDKYMRNLYKSQGKQIPRTGVNGCDPLAP
jgi:hypothetical protein